jgi:hypothetical protein
MPGSHAARAASLRVSSARCTLQLLAAGGLLSVLRDQDEVYFFNLSDPAHPKFIKGVNPPEGGCADEFRPAPGGGFLVGIWTAGSVCCCQRHACPVLAHWTAAGASACFVLAQGLIRGRCQHRMIGRFRPISSAPGLNQKCMYVLEVMHATACMSGRY